MAKDLADLVVTLELQSAKYQAGLDSATKKLNKFHTDTTSALSGIADAFAGFLSVDLLLDFAKSTIEASANLADFSKSAGITTESLSALQFAAKSGGVGVEALNTSLKKLNVSTSEAAGDSTSKSALAFQLLGVSVKDASGNIKSADTIFAEVADKFSKTADGANKVQLAVALFGKAGEALIPVLDEGSEGLKKLADDASAAGAIISGETAAAAKEFTDKMLLLKTTLVDGVGAQVEKQLLPVLNSLASEFLDSAKSGEELARVSDEIAAGFKILISGGLIVKEIFSQIGDAIGGAVAAIGAVLSGEFKRAGQILDDQSQHAKDSASKTATQLVDTWTSQAPKFNKAVDDTVDKTKKSLGSLSGAEAAQAALKQLEAFATQLQGEVAKLDQGTVAATKYKLAHGELAKALTLTGAAGQKLADQAIAAATQLETSQITKQLKSLQAELKSLSGDTVGAGLDNFNKSVETLERQLKDVGGATQESGQKIIDNLKQATQYTLEFNKAQTDSSRIQQDYSIKEQAINDARANGQITDIQQSQQLAALHQQEAADLQVLVDKQNALAAASGNPALIQNAKAFSAQIDHLKTQTDQFTNQVRDGLESAFANNFSDLITGAKSFGQAVSGLLKDIEKQFADLISKNLAQSLFGGGTGGADGGGGLLGGLAPALAGLFGGGNGGFGVKNAVISGVSQNGGTGGGIGNIVDSLDGFATGGVLASGQMGIVGENGPELITGQAGGTNVIPNGKGMGGDTHINNHFVIQAANGQISKQSQSQVAAAAARSLQQVNSRRLA